jgi:hypothetical protein
MECILASHTQYAECTRIKHVATTQLMTRREDGIRGMDHSTNPRNSRDAVQHTYKTRGSSSLVVQGCKSDIKENVLEVSKINHRLLGHLKEPKKIPLGPLGLFPSLTIQRIFQTQPI